MAQKIELNGHTFRVWFKHAQRDFDIENDKFIDAAIANAIDIGQIKKFGRIDHDPRPSSYFPAVKAATLCTIESNDNKYEVVATGYSFCSESEKQFVKSDARNRALGRAISEYWKENGGKVRNKK